MPLRVDICCSTARCLRASTCEARTSNACLACSSLCWLFTAAHKPSADSALSSFNVTRVSPRLASQLLLDSRPHQRQIGRHPIESAGLESPPQRLADSTTTAKPPQQAGDDTSSSWDYVEFHTLPAARICDVFHRLELQGKRVGARHWGGAGSFSADRGLLKTVMHFTRFASLCRCRRRYAGPQS